MLAKLSNYLKYVLVPLGIGFLIWGAFRGEAGLMLRKAINICLECVGIG